MVKVIKLDDIRGIQQKDSILMAFEEILNEGRLKIYEAEKLADK